VIFIQVSSVVNCESIMREFNLCDSSMNLLNLDFPFVGYTETSRCLLDFQEIGLESNMAKNAWNYFTI